MGKIRNPIRLPGPRSKYRAVKTEIDGIVFDSKAEAKQYAHLKQLESLCLIKNLVADKSKLRFEIKLNDVKICTYVADFSYFKQDGHFVVMDVKGFKTDVYRLKKKLFRACYGFDITEA